MVKITLLNIYFHIVIHSSVIKRFFCMFAKTSSLINFICLTQCSNVQHIILWIWIILELNASSDIIFFFFFCKWGNWGWKKSCDLPKVKQFHYYHRLVLEQSSWTFSPVLLCYNVAHTLQQRPWERKIDFKTQKCLDLKNC